MKMKDSGVEWIGVIPEDWTVQKVKHQFDRKKGKPETEDYEILKLARSGIQIRDISSGDGQIAADYSGYNPVEPLDILINPMDLISGDNSNISKVSGVISQAYINLRFRSSINPYFYNYYFKLQYWLGAFFTHGKGVSFDNRWTINDETLRNFPIIVPTLNEQNKIVEFLDSKLSLINQIIADTKRSIEELNSYKQSLITETVTKGLDPNVPMKDSGVEWIGEIPVDWITIKIKAISNIERGQFSHRPRNDERYYEGEHPFIQTGDVARADKWITQYSQTLSELGTTVSKQFSKETILMAIAANVGDVAILKFDSYLPDSVLGITPKDPEMKEYLYYSLLAQKAQLDFNSTSSTQKNLNVESVGKTVIAIPQDKIEASDIVRYLIDLDNSIYEVIESKKKIISEFEDYKKSLIYEYVTGKKRVN